MNTKQLLTSLISGNDMTQITSNQIRIQGSDATIDDNVINVDATITNNTGTVAGSFGAGLLVDVGDGSGIAKNDVRINVTGNNLNGTNTTPFFDFDITLNLNETSGASLRVTQASDAALAAANVATTVSSFSNPPNTITYNAGTPPTPPLPLLAAAGGVESASGTPGDHDLTSPELAVMVQAAVGRWASAGLTGVQTALAPRVRDSRPRTSAGRISGCRMPGVILIDDDAAGHGWFVDATPFDDAEFGHALSATQLQTDPSGAPAGHMDLLTLVMHEIGHVLGLDHSHEGSGGDLMSGSLVTGERRLPDASDTAGLSAPEIVGQNHRRRVRCRILSGAQSRRGGGGRRSACALQHPRLARGPRSQRVSSTPRAISRTTPTWRRQASIRCSTTPSTAGGKAAIRRRTSTRRSISRRTPTSPPQTSVRSSTSCNTASARAARRSATGCGANQVARLECNESRGRATGERVPAFAALKPGYGDATFCPYFVLEITFQDAVYPTHPAR